MIRYTLQCAKNHTFESWFANSAAYDKQAKRALIACPICNSTKVEKAIMAPRLGRSEPAAVEAPAPMPVPAEAPSGPPTSVAMTSPMERELRTKLKELREHIVKNADYVGRGFPEQARKIHYGETEHREIYGEATPAEATELREEGIAVAAVPWLRKSDS
jgi:hypothetical protein